MKKIKLLLLIIPFGLVLMNCSSTNTGKPEAKPEKKETKKVATTSYARDIAPMMTNSCTPCHFPPDGRKMPLADYAAVKAHIGEVIERVKLPQSDPKFMPFRNKKPALDEKQVAMLVKWQVENMPE